jgi:hypothetical protein
VFLSVVLAFFADDWRNRQDEARAAEASLRLVLRDLEQDRRGYARLRQALQEQEAAATSLLSLLGKDEATAEELSEAADRALGMMVFDPSYAAYQGLEQTGQLRAIRDAALRDLLVVHYTETLDYLEALRERELVAWERALALAARHFMWVAAEPPKVRRVVAVSSASEIRQDRAFLGTLGYLSSTRRWLDYRVGEFSTEDAGPWIGDRNERVIAALMHYLETGDR